MGGHGGLNILPQKRWNVYNRDNRLKVSQDEAKAKAKEDEEEARAIQAEREFRHQQLLARAGGGAGPTAAATSQTELEVVHEQGTGKLEHINFWKEDELQMREQHPEVKAAKLDEARKRGDAQLYTSDPKFDERFQFGYQMKSEQPWWSKVKSPPTMTTLPDPLAPQLTGTSSQQQQQPQQLLLAPSAQPALAAVDMGRHRKDRRKRRQHDSSNEASEDDSDVAAAKQFLRQALGGQHLQGITHHGNSSSSDSGSSDRSSGDSSGTDSGSDERIGERHRQGSKRRRSQSSAVSHVSSKSKRPRSGGKERRVEHKKDKHKRGKHKKERSKKSRSKGRTKQGDPQGLPAVKTVEQLRAERLEREQAERGRARLVLVGALEGPDASRGEPSGYNQAFGFAAGLKKTRPC